jgi:hypothetical protein
MLTCVVVEALRSSSPIMEALRLELVELPAAGRVSCRRRGTPYPRPGARGELPASVLGFFYAAIVVYWCCNSVLDTLQPFVFRM